MALFRCRYKLKCKVVMISTIVVIALTVSYIHSTLKETVSRDNSSGRGSYSRLFLSNDGQKEIYSDVCKIPRLPLYSSAIEHAIQPMKKPLICNGTNLFYVEDNVLSINNSVLYPEHNTLDLYEFKTKTGEINDKPTLKACEIRGIERVTDSFFTYTEGIVKKNGPFNMLIKHDFVHVKCLLNSTYNLIHAEDNEVEDYPSNDSLYNNNDPMEYEGSIFNEYLVDFDQFLVQVYPRDDVLKRAASQKPTSDQMNVMMIMLDSMSHMSFRRKLPKTYGYLKRNLASTILNGYNIVGDATLAALIPILTGNMNSYLTCVTRYLILVVYLSQFYVIFN